MTKLLQVQVAGAGAGWGTPGTELFQRLSKKQGRDIWLLKEGGFCLQGPLYKKKENQRLVRQFKILLPKLTLYCKLILTNAQQHLSCKQRIVVIHTN